MEIKIEEKVTLNITLEEAHAIRKLIGPTCSADRKRIMSEKQSEFLSEFHDEIVIWKK